MNPDPVDGVARVVRLEAERRRDGVPVEDETWNQIERVSAELGGG
jgi:LDH2 family malate/lactate/ureidoglycolate dehydrogenase